MGRTSVCPLCLRSFKLAMARRRVPQKIFLIGFMGSGKSRVGRVLSRRLGFDFIDLDSLIEGKMGVSIAEIFKSSGEGGFRDIESRILGEVVEGKGGDEVGARVVSTGGGIILRGENRAVMSGCGVTVYLRTPPRVIWDRVKHNTARPLLQVEGDPLEKICELLKERKNLYEQAADLVVDTENRTPEEVAEEIAQGLRELR